MKRGFTLIELMVASCLLGMLFVMMTMIFNQSSVAWRVGAASVSKLSDVRLQVGWFHEQADLALPARSNRKDKEEENLMIVPSLIDLIVDKGNEQKRLTVTGKPNGDFNRKEAGYAEGGAGKVGNDGSSDAFTIGVRSAGPDGEFDTDDDITTWPEDVN